MILCVWFERRSSNKRLKGLYVEELDNFYSLPCIVKVITFRRMRYVVDVVYMREISAC
jgi:hypothetical protein